jgi:hypothetical protein
LLLNISIFGTPWGQMTHIITVNKTDIVNGDKANFANPHKASPISCIRVQPA